MSCKGGCDYRERRYLPSMTPVRKVVISTGNIGFHNSLPAKQIARVMVPHDAAMSMQVGRHSQIDGLKICGGCSSRLRNESLEV